MLKALVNKKYFRGINMYLYILIISCLISIPKWIFQFQILHEDIYIKTILDFQDSLYFPLIKTFSELNLNPSYNEVGDLKLLSYPFFGLIINSIFYKFFGIYSFYLLEIVCIFIFLSIFYNIFISINSKSKVSILFSVLLFLSIYVFRDLFNLLNFDLLNNISISYQNLYSLRLPRPIISNLFLFAYFFYIYKFYIENTFNKKYFIYLNLISALTLHNFFYYFIFQIIFISLVYIYKFRKNAINIFINNLKIFAVSFLIIIFSFTIYQTQIVLSEPDYMQRIGVINIDTKQKIILLKYFFNFIFKIEFLLLFLILTIINFKYDKIILQISYLFFLSTIISTLLFIIISSRGVDYYHFYSWIISSGFLMLFFTVAVFFNDKVFFKFNEKKNLIIIIILLSISYINYSMINEKKNSNKNNIKSKIELNKLVNFFESMKYEFKKDYEILNLNEKFGIWLILNEFSNFTIVPNSFWTSKTNKAIDKELISIFKFLNLDVNYFLEFISNQERGYRYKNIYVQRLYDRVYLANSLKTFDKNNNYTNNELEFIGRSSPLISHQLIIPKNEFVRFKNDYINNLDVINPEIIVFDANVSAFKKASISDSFYCQIYSSNEFKVYIQKKIFNKC